MSAEEDIAKFHSWARTLAIPQTYLPNKSALETVMKTAQRDLLFMDILRRVKPKTDVSKIKKSIVIDKIANLSKSAQIYEKYLPEECKKSLKLSELKNRKKDLENIIEKSKDDSKTLLNNINDKNSQNSKLEQTINDLRIRINLFGIKSDVFEKQINQEASTKRKITKSVPVKIKNCNSDTEKAVEQVNELITMLEKFYKDYDSNSNLHLVKDLQQNLWHQLQQMLNKIPTYTIFNTVLKLVEDQIQNVLSIRNSLSISTNDSTTSSSDFSDMEKQVLRSQMSIFVNTARLASVKRAYAINFDKFTEGYHTFFDSVKNRVDMFNNTMSEDVEIIVSEYITQYNTITYKRAQNEDLRREIEICKTKIEENKKLLDKNSLILITLKDIYENIQSIADKILNEILGWNLVKDKILFWKNTIAGEFISNCNKQKTSRLHNSFLNSSVGMVNRMDLTNSSLDLTAEQGGVFSSTKVDFEATLSVTLQRFGDISMLPTKRFVMPNHVMEILTFSETPISSFENITKEGLFYINSDDSHRDDIRRAFASSLTHDGIVNELRLAKNWSDDVNSLLKAHIPQIHCPLVDLRKFTSNVKKQDEVLAEVFDKINSVSLKNMQTLKTASRISKFVHVNPLRNYVPKTHKYKNVSYEEYESEFLMYYRICQN